MNSPGVKLVQMRNGVVVLVALWGAVASGEGLAPRSFAYVLQADRLARSRADAVRRLAACGRDWMVVDACYDGGVEGRWTAAEVTSIRQGKAGRKVLAYLSIGEAETYRPYWCPEWDANHDGQPDRAAPGWLCDENPDWEGNFKVRYWDPGWQAQMLTEVDRIVRTGFDGVYLDIVDAFEFFEYESKDKEWIDHRPNPATGRTYREDMVGWVGRIAAHARASSPGFLVVPQNGVQLLEDATFLATVDAIGVEDLFTLGEKPQEAEHTAYVLPFLAKVRQAGKPVLVIEYGSGKRAVKRSREGTLQNGFVLLLTDRELKTLR